MTTHDKKRSQSLEGLLHENMYGTGYFIYGAFFTYTPGTPRYEPLGPPVHVPRMWGVERDPRASLGRWDHGSLGGCSGWWRAFRVVEGVLGTRSLPWEAIRWPNTRFGGTQGTCARALRT